MTAKEAELFILGRNHWSPAEFGEWAADQATDIVKGFADGVELLIEETLDFDFLYHLEEIIKALTPILDLQHFGRVA